MSQSPSSNPVMPLDAAALAEIAHELRAPLGGIDSMVSLLLDSALNDQQRKMVEALRASSAHLRVIADRILAPVAGEEPVLGRQALQIVMDAFALSLEARASIKGLRANVALSPEIDANAMVELAPLRQVLENLTDNAVRMTESGSITVSVATHPDGGRLVFAVVDTGPGLSHEDAARLIREGGAVEGHKGGAGLGLSIAGRLVALRGGALTGGPRVEGTGTAFSFEWPLLTGEHMIKDQTDGAQTRYLVVDDHPASRLILKTILGSQKLMTEEVADVQTALLCLSQHSYRAVFTDLQMPNGHGDDLIDAIRAMPIAQRPAVIVVSADRPDPERHAASAIAGFIQKPISIRAVLEALRDIDQSPARISSAA